MKSRYWILIALGLFFVGLRLIFGGVNDIICTGYAIPQLANSGFDIVMFYENCGR